MLRKIVRTIKRIGLALADFWIIPAIGEDHGDPRRRLPRHL